MEKGRDPRFHKGFVFDRKFRSFNFASQVLLKFQKKDASNTSLELSAIYTSLKMFLPYGCPELGKTEKYPQQKLTIVCVNAENLRRYRTR